MTIYAEYLFMENALIGYMILYLTALLCAVHIKIGRLVQGAVLCGLYAFMILIPGLHPAILTGSKLVASVLIVWVSFREKKIGVLLKRVGVFYAVTILLAGMCFFVIYTGAASGVISTGGFYVQTGSYGSIIIGVLLGFICIKWLWDHIKQRSCRQEADALITIYVNGNIYKTKGIIDTGNFLRDPISGKPVIIADRVRMALEKSPEEQGRYRAIPYKALGNETGMMDGMRADRVCICRGDITAEQENPIIALYDGKLFEGKEYGAIVHPSMLLKV